MSYSVSISGHVDVTGTEETAAALEDTKTRVADFCDTLPGCSGASVNGTQVWTPTGRPGQDEPQNDGSGE